jgi:hypothetical protein
VLCMFMYMIGWLADLIGWLAGWLHAGVIYTHSIRRGCQAPQTSRCHLEAR